MLTLAPWNKYFCRISGSPKLTPCLGTQTKEGEEEISCDTPKYWLDEAQALELGDDKDSDNETNAKIARLSDLVDDLDLVLRTCRICSTKDQLISIIKYAQDKVAPRLCYRRLESEFVENSSARWTQKEPLAYLQQQFKKKNEEGRLDGDGDAQMADEDSSSDSDEGDDEEQEVDENREIKPKKTRVRKPKDPNAKPKTPRQKKSGGLKLPKEKKIKEKRESKAALKK